MSLINQCLGSFVKDVDRLRNIVRYATSPRNARETVAEHSYFVAVYVLKLHDYYEFDLEKALSLSLLHDFPEIYISDVPHPIKKQNPELEKALEEAENRVTIERLSEKAAQWLREFNECSSKEGTVAAFADALSVVSYASYEISLGNRDYMLTVYDSVKGRCVDLLKKMESFGRPGVDLSHIEEEVKSVLDKSDVKEC